MPWSAPIFLNTDPNYEESPTALYNGSGGIDFAMIVWNYTTSMANVSFLRYRTSGTGAAPELIGSSQPNGAGASAGTVWPVDHVSLARDSAGRVFAAWGKSGLYTTDGSEHIYVSTSPDETTWGTPVLANAPADHGNDKDPVLRTGPGGRVWLAYTDQYGSLSNLTFASSTDHGATFQGSVNLSNPTPRWIFQGYDYQVDPAGGLHLVYSECSDFYLCNLWYTSSPDGTTWTPRVELVAGNGTGITPFASQPALLFEPPSTLKLAWVDGRTSGANYYTIYYMRSDDLGATWGPMEPISQGVMPPNADAHSLGLAEFGDTLMAAWGASNNGLSWAVSPDDGVTWYPEQYQITKSTFGTVGLAVDGNGTFVLDYLHPTVSATDAYAVVWNGPPDPPSGVSVAPAGLGRLAVSWHAPIAGDLSMYYVYRSPDGSTYALAGVVDAPTTSFTDSGLANGTYWYKVLAVDLTAHLSHDSVPVLGTVGPSLLDQINALRQELSSASADLSTIQAQINALRGELAASQENTTALQDRLNMVQSQLNQMRDAQTLTTLLLIVVVVVLAIQTFLLVRMRRRPKGPAGSPPGAKFPEDEL